MINEIHEHKQVNEWLECDMQTIKDHLNVDKLYLAAEIKNLQDQFSNKQSQIVESTQSLYDISIYLKSKTNIEVQAEELEVSLFRRVRKKSYLYSFQSSDKVWCHPITSDLIRIIYTLF
jgi:hypothetical protein